MGDGFVEYEELQQGLRKFLAAANKQIADEEAAKPKPPSGPKPSDASPRRN